MTLKLGDGRTWDPVKTNKDSDGGPPGWEAQYALGCWYLEAFKKQPAGTRGWGKKNAACGGRDELLGIRQGVLCFPHKVGEKFQTKGVEIGRKSGKKSPPATTNGRGTKIRCCNLAGIFRTEGLIMKAHFLRWEKWWH